MEKKAGIIKRKKEKVEKKICYRNEWKGLIKNSTMMHTMDSSEISTLVPVHEGFCELLQLAYPKRIVTKFTVGDVSVSISPKGKR